MKKKISVKQIVSRLPTDVLAMMWFNHNHRYYYCFGNVIQRLSNLGWEIETFDYATIFHAIRDELDLRSGNV